MNDKKTVNLVINLIAPLLPILAVLIFRYIGQAVELFIVSLIVFVVVLWSLISFLRLSERSTGLRVLSTVTGVLGLIITTVIGLLSGWTMMKV
jgi:heme/copper-type cytochrome/quinol oxidase subunit 4